MIPRGFMSDGLGKSLIGQMLAERVTKGARTVQERTSSTMVTLIHV